MSTNNVNFNNGQQMQVNTSLAKLFAYKKEIIPYVYTNGGGAPVNLAAGTVIGVIAATGKVVPFTSAAVDGSQFPIGILAQDYTVAAGATINVAVAINGTEVRQDLLLLQGGDTLSTVVSGRRVFEWLLVAGIRPLPADSFTNYENTLP